MPHRSNSCDRKRGSDYGRIQAIMKYEIIRHAQKKHDDNRCYKEPIELYNTTTRFIYFVKE